VSYSFLKQTLQAAGLVKTHRAHGRHRRRREPWAGFDEVLYAQLWGGESTAAVMTALREVITTYGLPMAICTDRPSGRSTRPGPTARSIVGN
jgi:hypothetical protein